MRCIKISTIARHGEAYLKVPEPEKVTENDLQFGASESEGSLGHMMFQKAPKENLHYVWHYCDSRAECTEEFSICWRP